MEFNEDLTVGISPVHFSFEIGMMGLKVFRFATKSLLICPTDD